MSKYRNMHADSQAPVRDGILCYTVFFSKYDEVPEVGETVIINGFKRKIIDIRVRHADFRGDRDVEISVHQFPKG